MEQEGAKWWERLGGRDRMPGGGGQGSGQKSQDRGQEEKDTTEGRRRVQSESERTPPAMGLGNPGASRAAAVLQSGDWPVLRALISLRAGRWLWERTRVIL